MSHGHGIGLRHAFQPDGKLLYREHDANEAQFAT